MWAEVGGRLAAPRPELALALGLKRSLTVLSAPKAEVLLDSLLRDMMLVVEMWYEGRSSVCDWEREAKERRVYNRRESTLMS